MILRVQDGWLWVNDISFPCAIGRNGFSTDKREGDGCTPIGTFPLRECWYRDDRLAPPETRLPLRIIQRNDGWCDDPKHPAYNRHFKICSPLPATPSAEAAGFAVASEGERAIASAQRTARAVGGKRHGPNTPPTPSADALRAMADTPPHASAEALAKAEGGREIMPASFERLWRRDGRYDLIIPLGYNDDPVITGKGSAIFLHVAAKGYTPTQGCVALAKPDLLALLPLLSTECRIEILPPALYSA